LEKEKQVRKWLTSSGGQPTPYNGKDGYTGMKWNSGGFAPAWI
jgi:hypothetical protein